MTDTTDTPAARLQGYSSHTLGGVLTMDEFAERQRAASGKRPFTAEHVEELSSMDLRSSYVHGQLRAIQERTPKDDTAAHRVLAWLRTARPETSKPEPLPSNPAAAGPGTPRLLSNSDRMLIQRHLGKGPTELAEEDLRALGALRSQVQAAMRQPEKIAGRRSTLQRQPGMLEDQPPPGPNVKAEAEADLRLLQTILDPVDQLYQLRREVAELKRDPDLRRTGPARAPQVEGELIGLMATRIRQEIPELTDGEARSRAERRLRDYWRKHDAERAQLLQSKRERLTDLELQIADVEAGRPPKAPTSDFERRLRQMFGDLRTLS